MCLLGLCDELAGTAASAVHTAPLTVMLLLMCSVRHMLCSECCSSAVSRCQEASGSSTSAASSYSGHVGTSHGHQHGHRNTLVGGH